MDDTRIAMLFGEWLAAERFANDDGGDNNKFHDKADELIHTIAAEPATGLFGVMCKTLLLAHDICAPGHRPGDDPCAVRLPPDDGYLCEVLARGLLLDAVRLAPGLAPLIVAATRLPRPATGRKRRHWPGRWC